MFHISTHDMKRIAPRSRVSKDLLLIVGALEVLEATLRLGLSVVKTQPSEAVAAQRNRRGSLIPAATVFDQENPR
jgi:hypothetical protein